MARPAKSSALPPARRLLFWLVLLALPLAALAALELAARALGGGRAPLDRHLTFGGRPEFFDTVEVGGRLHYRVSHPQAYRGRDVRFPAEKPPGTRRIFCLGGSASAGWPHPPEHIWTVDLQHALSHAFPEKDFEVLNVGAHAYPSYRIRFLFERTLDFDPDFLVVYSGNNEFLEPRSYLRGWRGLERVEALAGRLALFRQLRGWWVRWRMPENFLEGDEALDVSLNVWTKLARSSLALREDPEQLAGVKRHYADTITAMVEAAAERGVPVLLATLPVNLRDWVPNVSVGAPEGEAGARWRERVREGRGALLEGDAERAVALLGRAAEEAPRHAETHYRLGQALERAGRHEAALAAYQRASDLDHNPFRALSDFNHTLRAIAAAHPNAHLADLEAAFRARSAPQAPGFDLFLDYVHPTLEGGRVAARAVFDGLLRAGLMGRPPPTGVAFVPAPHAGYDEERDDGLQGTLFWLFGMMHQYEAMLRKAEQLRARGSQLPVLRPVLNVFRDWLYLERRELLGQPVGAGERERIEERVAEYYWHTYRFDPDADPEAVGPASPPGPAARAGSRP